MHNIHNNKNIFVTGATGFVGSNLVKRLIRENYNVHISYRKTSNLWRIRSVFDKLYSYEVDLLVKDTLHRVIKKINPNIIFHLANVGIYGGIESSPEKVANGNFIATANLISACNDVPYECFINTGSSSEYGPRNSVMHEGDTCNPQSIYAITKLAATLYAQMQAKVHGKPIVTLRLFSPYGPYDEKRRLIPYAITQSLQGKPLCLVKPNFVRDYIFIDDVVDAYLLCINNQKIFGEIINIGFGKQETVSRVIDAILDITKTKSIVSWNNTVQPRYESSTWIADITKAKKLLGLSPKTTFEEGIIKTIKWYKQDKYLFL